MWHQVESGLLTQFILESPASASVSSSVLWACWYNLEGFFWRLNEKVCKGPAVSGTESRHNEWEFYLLPHQWHTQPTSQSVWGSLLRSGCTSLPPLGVSQFPGRTHSPTHFLGNSCTFYASGRKGWGRQQGNCHLRAKVFSGWVRPRSPGGPGLPPRGVRMRGRSKRGRL